MTNLSHSFTVNSIDTTKDVDVCINILKRRTYIQFYQSMPMSATNIAFASNTNIDSNNSLSIADRSTSVIANRVLETGYTTVEDINSFTINTDNFVVTNIFVDLSNTTDATPLFYKHVLSSDKLPRDTNGNIQSGYTLQSIEILDEYLQTMLVQEKKINYTNGIVYLNLQSVFNSFTDYSVYYVKYKIRTDSGEIFEHIDLLNTEPIFKVASFEDLDESLTIINDGRTVYIIQQEDNSFTITLPYVDTYSYKIISTGRIRLLKPTAKTISDSWFVKISNNYIYTTINSTLYKYSIGEFLSQAFYPAPPYKTIQNEESSILSSTLIKLDQDNIVIDTEADMHLTILIDDANGNGKAAYTTDSTLAGSLASNGIYYKIWNSIDQQGIKSFDSQIGIIEIDGIELKSTYVITSSYVYEEHNYEYTAINFNPMINNSVLSGRVSIFVDPDTITTHKDQTLYYLNIDEAGKVIESNYPYFNNTSQLWNIGAGDKILYYEELPDFITTGIADIGEPSYLDPDSVDFFVPNYTTEGSNYVNFLVLGDITVNPGITIDDITTIDSRRRGGGILDTELENTIDNVPEASLVWDQSHWDGFPYPGNASYYVEVPSTLLIGSGGELTQQKIREIVERHTAAGVYPIVKTYGVDISIDSIEPTASGITIRWESNGY